MKSRIWPKRSARMCRRSHAASDSTTGSARNFFMPGRALIKTAQDHDAPMRIVEAVLAVNENRKRAMARKVASVFGGTLRGKTVSVLGLTFKPNTDDMRESPSIPLITALQDLGAKIRAYDPEGMEQSKTELSEI